MTRFPTSAILALATAIFFLAPASSHAAFGGPVCLARSADGMSCAVSTQATGFMICTIGGSVILELHQGPSLVQSNVLHDDLLASVTDRSLTPQQAEALEAELLTRQDIVYRLPTDPAQLRISVGFAPESVFSPVDQVELLKVHLQIFLGVSAPTSAYLAERLGVKALMPREQTPAI